MRVHALQYDIAWEDKPVSQARMDALIAATPPEPGSLLVTPELGDVGFSLNIDALVDDVVGANEEAVASVREGDDKPLNFLMGKVMKASQGKANPEEVRSRLIERIRGSSE